MAWEEGLICKAEVPGLASCRLFPGVQASLLADPQIDTQAPRSRSPALGGTGGNCRGTPRWGRGTSYPTAFPTLVTYQAALTSTPGAVPCQAPPAGDDLVN